MMFVSAGSYFVYRKLMNRKVRKVMQMVAMQENEEEEEAEEEGEEDSSQTGVRTWISPRSDLGTEEFNEECDEEKLGPDDSDTVLVRDGTVGSVLS